MNDSFSSAKELVNQYFENISDTNKNVAQVVSSWRGILNQINNNRQQDTKRVDIGSQLADHSKIIEFKNGTLFVETDHPTRIQLFQFYKDFILKELKKKYPELKIQNVSFFIGKQKKEVSEGLRDITSEELDKAIEKRTGNFTEEVIEQTKEIPENIKKMFEGFFK
ncbi:MAG: DUF721 domain-containing protein [Spirochaetaceae bacterium]|nr:DUF721 domain-containing protein [Spirochaetaceae bacterium]MBO4705066.1 DUF721 domain-containing protein [Spirochaetaceae bacterium]